MHKNHSGFHLSIILVGVAIVAILSALSLVFWQNISNKKAEEAKSEIDLIRGKQSQNENIGWKKFSNIEDLYSIEYPSDWIVRWESGDGPYLRNFDPTSRPAEDPANNKNYPEGYINLRIFKTESDDAIFLSSNATEWYEKLGSSTVSLGPATYTPDMVSSYEMQGMAAKKTKTVFTETNEDIFLLKDGSLYQINIYPYGASEDATVKKMIDSFKVIDKRQAMIDAIQD